MIGLEGVVNHGLQPRCDGVGHREFTDVGVIGLDVPRLVHGLGGRVELALVIRDGMGESCRSHQGALFAVQEL